MNQMNKRITSMLLSGAMLLTLLPAGALAADGGPDHGELPAVTDTVTAPETAEDALPTPEESGDGLFSGGTGTQEDPYRIQTPEQLKAFRDSVNGGESYRGQYIRLDGDVDLAGEDWTPIGTGTAPFQGTFDGGAHTISHLTVRDGELDYAGLFGVVRAAVVRDLTVEGVSVTAREAAGGLVGLACTDTSISGCTVRDAAVSGGTLAIGGLVGLCTDEGAGDGSLTGSTVENITLSSGHPGVAMGYLLGGARSGGSVADLPGGGWTQSGNRVLGRNSGGNGPCVTVNDFYYPALEAAVAAAGRGDTVKLWSDLTLNGGAGDKTGLITLSADRLTLDGGGFTLSAGAEAAALSSLINVEDGTGMVIRNLTLVGSAAVRHGINANRTGLTLEHVTVRGMQGYGVVCNSSELTINGLTTSGNRWGGINVDTGTTRDSHLTVMDAALEEMGSIVFENRSGQRVTAVLSGGTFQSVGVHPLGVHIDQISIRIDGGHFQALSNVSSAESESGKTAALTVYGGSFAADPGPYLAQGAKAEEKDGRYEVTFTAPGGGSSGSGGDADPDENTGDKTEVTTHPDGSTTTTVTRPDGTVSTTTVTQTGQVESQVEISQGAVDAAGENGTVSLPIPAVPAGEDRTQAPTVTVSLPGDTAARVEVPVEKVTAGTVAVLVKADGTEEVIKTSLATENGVLVTLSGGETIKIVDNRKTFADVDSDHWGAESIDFTSSRELFAGTGAATFSPEWEMTRAMVVTVLARYEGVDTTSGNTWYEAGSRWAVEHGISDGSDLEGAVTREQLAAMLWRYAGSPASDGSTEHFADGDQVSPWAAGAMAWAVETGLLSGTGDGALAPQGPATRAQVAAILARFVENTNR